MVWNANVADSEILAVHAALVPGPGPGEVILFGGDEHWSVQAEPGGDFRKTRVYDVAGHELLDPDPPIPSPDSDVFCAHDEGKVESRVELRVEVVLRHKPLEGNGDGPVEIATCRWSQHRSTSAVCKTS